MRVVVMTALLAELRPAIRRLLSDRWTALAAVLAAALGAGLNTAVFAVAYGVLLRPLPYRSAERLVIVDVDAPLARIVAWRSHLAAFDRMTGYARDRFTVRGVGDARLVGVAVVDDEFFDTLDARSIAGAPFHRGDPAAVAVVSERFVRETGTSAPSMLGRPLTVGGTPVVIVAVMPAAFAFPAQNIDVWMPARAAPAIAFDRSPDARHFNLVARLRPGVSLAQARGDVARAQAIVDPPGDRTDAPRPVTGLEATITREVRPALIAFTIASIVVLIVACANIATILIGRTTSRRRELAVRRALGASPSRLMMSVLSESILIAVAGAAAGMLLAAVALRVVERWAAGIVPRLGDIRIDGIVVGVACGVAALSAALGAMPAFRALNGGAISLRAGGAGPRGAAGRTRGTLIVIQIALAVVLLTTGALLVRTMVGLLRSDAGIQPEGAVASQLMLTETTRFDAAGRGPLLDELLRRVRAMPDVIAAGAGSSLPPDNAFMEIRVRMVTGMKEQVHSLSLAAVTPGYLPALGARLLAGRHFEARDARPDRTVAVISESAARALLDGREPIGRELPMPLPGLRDRPRATVIGVVGDIKYAGLDGPAGATIYVPWSELPTGQAFLAVRSSRARSLPVALRTVLREVDPGMPVQNIRSLDDVLARSVADRRLRALVGGSVACLAFAVALVGLAGGLARVVSERRYELAIRAALGATPSRAMRMIMAEGASLGGAGLAIGIAGSLASGRAIGSMLSGVSPHDPLTFAGVSAIVSVLVAGACYVPARRASRVDPLELLRADA